MNNNCKKFNLFQARLREAASLEKHVLLKKLRDALESLRGRVAGKNQDDVEEAIAMVRLLWIFFFFLLFVYCFYLSILTHLHESKKRKKISPLALKCKLFLLTKK